MTIQGPFKAPPSFADKVANFLFSKSIVEKFSKKLIRYDPVKQVFEANTKGLFLYYLLYTKTVDKATMYSDLDGDGFADYFYEYEGMCVNAR